MNHSNSLPLTLHGDQEHGRLRLAVVAILIAILYLLYLLFSWLFRLGQPAGPPSYAGVLSCAGALVLGLGLTAAAEAGLKRVWHSGRRVVLNEDGVRLTRAAEDELSIRWAQPATVLRWHFRLKGYPRSGVERRQPTSTYCVGCQLQQEDTRIVCFAFLPPKAAAKYMGDKRFHALDPADVYDTTPLRLRFDQTSRPSLPAEVLRGRDGPYWLAERARWEQGLELTARDFDTLMRVLDSKGI